MTDYRQETDSIGTLSIPEHALYGIQTARSIENFQVGNRNVNSDLILAIVQVKKAAAMANSSLSLLSKEKTNAIISACNEILEGRHSDAFITNALQGGAGTSTNMNVNEVIANLALLSLGHKPGEYEFLHPLDDVNKSQSTNDVYPTALRISAIQQIRKLANECALLQDSLQKKEQEFSSVLKLGRTEMMDALPITLGQEFGAYAQAIARDRWRIYKTEERLRMINLGGTAIGTGCNASVRYSFAVTEILRDLTGIGLARSEYPVDLTQNADVFVEVSGLLKALAANLMKISGDLRLLSSGPNGGFGEIRLKALQAGSTIMPGKVNPVIPEMMTQIAIKVMANDTAISMAAGMGNLELNAFLPLIADTLLESLSLLADGVKCFRTKCIDSLEAHPDNCMKHLKSSFALVTGLTPYIGYEKACQIIVECENDSAKIEEVIKKQGLLDQETLQKILNYQWADGYIR